MRNEERVPKKFRSNAWRKAAGSKVEEGAVRLWRKLRFAELAGCAGTRLISAGAVDKDIGRSTEYRVTVSHLAIHPGRARHTTTTIPPDFADRLPQASAQSFDIENGDRNAHAAGAGHACRFAARASYDRDLASQVEAHRTSSIPDCRLHHSVCAAAGQAAGDQDTMDTG